MGCEMKKPFLLSKPLSGFVFVLGWVVFFGLLSLPPHKGKILIIDSNVLVFCLLKLPYLDGSSTGHCCCVHMYLVGSGTGK